MGSKIVVGRWTEPEIGTSAEMWSLNPIEWEEVQKAIDWVVSYWEENENSGDGEDAVGNTIIEHSLHKTEAQGYEPFCDNLEFCLQRLADNVRYSSGESLYEKDCPVFKNVSIERS